MSYSRNQSLIKMSKSFEEVNPKVEGFESSLSASITTKFSAEVSKLLAELKAMLTDAVARGYVPGKQPIDPNGSSSPGDQTNIPQLPKPPDPPDINLSTKRSTNKRVPQKYSCEEIYERMENGFCILCEELDTSGHYQSKHKGTHIFVVENDDNISDEEKALIAPIQLPKPNPSLPVITTSPPASLYPPNHPVLQVSSALVEKDEVKTATEENLSQRQNIEHLVCKQSQRISIGLWSPGNFSQAIEQQDVTIALIHSSNEAVLVWEPGGMKGITLSNFTCEKNQFEGKTAKLGLQIDNLNLNRTFEACMELDKYVWEYKKKISYKLHDKEKLSDLEITIEENHTEGNIKRDQLSRSHELNQKGKEECFRKENIMSFYQDTGWISTNRNKMICSKAEKVLLEVLDKRVTAGESWMHIYLQRSELIVNGFLGNMFDIKNRLPCCVVKDQEWRAGIVCDKLNKGNKEDGNVKVAMMLVIDHYKRNDLDIFIYKSPCFSRTSTRLYNEDSCSCLWIILKDVMLLLEFFWLNLTLGVFDHVQEKCLVRLKKHITWKEKCLRICYVLDVRSKTIAAVVKHISLSIKNYFKELILIIRISSQVWHRWKKKTNLLKLIREKIKKTARSDIDHISITWRSVIDVDYVPELLRRVDTNLVILSCWLFLNNQHIKVMDHLKIMVRRERHLGFTYGVRTFKKHAEMMVTTRNAGIKIVESLVEHFQDFLVVMFTYQMFHSPRPPEGTRLFGSLLHLHQTRSLKSFILEDKDVLKRGVLLQQYK